jgi:glucan endo-1,3-alpha-glucosidase
MKSLSTLFTIAGAFTSLVQALPLYRPLNKRDGNQKYVVAHMMVGNTYPYTQGDWEADIRQAHGSGIDGFALNIGSDSWQSSQVASA